MSPVYRTVPIGFNDLRWGKIWERQESKNKTASSLGFVPIFYENSFGLTYYFLRESLTCLSTPLNTLFNAL